MPENINLLGLIASVLPGARVILCIRDPYDVAVSCWQAGFATVPWANTFEHIARRLADHERLLEHCARFDLWRGTRSATKTSLAMSSANQGSSSTFWASTGTLLVLSSTQLAALCEPRVWLKFANRLTRKASVDGSTIKGCSIPCFGQSNTIATYAEMLSEDTDCATRPTRASSAQIVGSPGANRRACSQAATASLIRPAFFRADPRFRYVAG